MGLYDLLSKQERLNGVLDAYPETEHDLTMALIEACGEVARELRPQWMWWSWDETAKGAVNRDRLLEKLASLLKFSLVGLLSFPKTDDSCQIIETARSYWECDWAILCADNLSEEMHDMLVAFPDGKGWKAIGAIARVCAKLEISKAELEAAYLALWQKNMDRCAARKADEPGPECPRL